MTSPAWFARGPRGPGVSSGSGAPVTGSDGDFYVDVDTGDLYSYTTSWAKVGNIKGPQGVQGDSDVFVGDALPATGATGKLYVIT